MGKHLTVFYFHRAPVMADTAAWTTALSPAQVMALPSPSYFQRCLSPCAPDEVGSRQVCVGWGYLAALLLALRALTVVAAGLDGLDGLSGRAAASAKAGAGEAAGPPAAWAHGGALGCCLCLVLAGLVGLLSAWAAAVRHVIALEGFLGDEQPLPLRQVIRSITQLPLLRSCLSAKSRC